MRHRASVVLPEPEPPSTAAWRLSTFLFSLTGRVEARQLAPGEDARAVAAVLIEDDGERQLVLLGTALLEAAVGQQRRRSCPGRGG